jgi:protein-S-isoprenylcysteine O-methyltransferase Ste14
MTVQTKFTINAFVASASFSVVLFLAAGRIDYFEGWLYTAASLASALANVLAIKKNPDLMNERRAPGEGIKQWDKRLLGLSFLVSLTTILLAGLDSGRFRLSPELHWTIYLPGLLLIAAGQSLFLVARHENMFFYTVVRIQKEPGQTVCTTGVYSIVRHPGYAGMIVSTIGLPLVLGSIWTLIPTIFAVMLLCVRTSLEDRTLMDELEGYPEYSKKTPYRLVPWIW